MSLLIMFGAPGIGKGTQSGLLKDRFGYVHTSTGDMARKEVEEGTSLGQKIREYPKGELLPDDLILDMVKERVVSARGKIIFDGFPRTISQAKAFNLLIPEKAYDSVHVINLFGDMETSVERITYRAKIEGREDDKDPETVRTRLQEYSKKTQPLINYFGENPVYSGRVHYVNSLRKPLEVHSDIVERLGLNKS